MVSQELPKEPISNVLHQCAVSDMNDSRSRSRGVCYDFHWNGVDCPLVRPHSLPSSFQPHASQSCRSMEPFSVGCKEDDFHGFSSVQNHGLSLSLGPELELNNVRPYNYNQSHIQQNAMRNKSVIGVVYEPPCSRAEHSRDDGMVCDGDVDGNIYDSRYSNSMALVISVLQKSPYLKAAQQLLDEVVCVSNSFPKPSSEKNARRKNWIKGNLHTAREEQDVNRMNKLLTLQEEV